MYIALKECHGTSSRSNRRYASGWTHYPIMTTAGPSSTPTCWPTTLRHSASRIRATLGGRSANFDFTCSASTDHVLAGPRRRVILLTMFHKTQRSEVAEVERAFI